MKEKKKWWLYKDKKENKFIKFMDKYELWVALEILVTMFIVGGAVLVLLLMIGLYG
jgi:flagellar basal body-associated protein FliL